MVGRDRSDRGGCRPTAPPARRRWWQFGDIQAEILVGLDPRLRFPGKKITLRDHGDRALRDLPHRGDNVAIQRHRCAPKTGLALPASDDEGWFSPKVKVAPRSRRSHTFTESAEATSMIVASSTSTLDIGTVAGL